MIRLVLFILLSLPIFSYVMPISQGTQTLQQLASSQSSQNSLFSKAVSFLWRIHPELRRHRVVSTKKASSRGDQAYANNLNDFHFDLALGNQRILAIVTVSVGGSKEFVSISPFVITVSSEPSSGGMGTYWISQTIPTGSSSPIINQPVSSNMINKAPLGSFRTLSNLNDPIAQMALDKMAAEHPNMVNYKVLGVSYQTVAGTNIRIQYEGIDQYSKVIAIINIDLKNNAKIIAFGAQCLSKKQFCNNQIVWDYFNSIQLIIVRHPELMSYRIKDLEINSKKGGVATAKVTFEKKSERLLTLVDMEIGKGKTKVLSFFTYSS